MKKYDVMYRVNDEWSDEFYSEPYIEAESEAEAIDIAKEFVEECGYDSDSYDWMAKEME